MSDKKKYGKYYWCVAFGDQGAQQVVRLFAHKAEVLANGDLVFWGNDMDSGDAVVNFAASAGSWTYFYAASVLDGGAIAVEHWDSK